MSNYKNDVLQKFGTKSVEFKFSDLQLPDGKELDDDIAGESIFVRKLSGKAVMDTLAGWADLKTGADKAVDAEGKVQVDIGDERTREIQASLVAIAQTDPEGELLWTDAQECNDSLNFGFLQAAFLACLQVNGMHKTATEEVEGN